MLQLRMKKWYLAKKELFKGICKVYSTTAVEVSTLYWTPPNEGVTPILDLPDRRSPDHRKMWF